MGLGSRIAFGKAGRNWSPGNFVFFPFQKTSSKWQSASAPHGLQERPVNTGKYWPWEGLGRQSCVRCNLPPFQISGESVGRADHCVFCKRPVQMALPRLYELI